MSFGHCSCCEGFLEEVTMTLVLWQSVCPRYWGWGFCETCSNLLHATSADTLSLISHQLSG